MKRKESLRLRLAALTGGIMLTASVLLALLASYNARDKFVEAP